MIYTYLYCEPPAIMKTRSIVSEKRSIDLVTASEISYERCYRKNATLLILHKMYGRNIKADFLNRN